MTDVFGDTDVYEAYPPRTRHSAARSGAVGHEAGFPPANYPKNVHDGGQQGVNTPMMPVAWTREIKTNSGKTQRILCTTMGAATDLASEGLRRLVVNGVFWATGLDVPAKADVGIVGSFTPLMYGNNGFHKKVKPSAHALDAGAK